MNQRGNDQTTSGNLFAREFTALGALCAAGYLWLLAL